MPIVIHWNWEGHSTSKTLQISCKETLLAPRTALQAAAHGIHIFTVFSNMEWAFEICKNVHYSTIRWEGTRGDVPRDDPESKFQRQPTVLYVTSHTGSCEANTPDASTPRAILMKPDWTFKLWTALWTATFSQDYHQLDALTAPQSEF